MKLQLIEQSPDQVNKLVEWMKWIFHDLGLAPPKDATEHAYNVKRFYQLVGEKYPHYTMDDVKEMFKMYVSGELEGVKDHYGRWSANFFMSVARAYHTHWQRKPGTNKALPQETIEGAKQKALDEFHKTIIVYWEGMRESGILKSYGKTAYVYRFWQEKGHLSQDVTITENDMANAFKVLSRGAHPMAQRPSEREIRERADFVAREREIEEFYRRVMEEGKHIKEYL